ncbi:MAG: holo-ACP synthase [Clostridia bacterium]|nr:holo-ACP synthase [Clostridia bacterium]
MCKARGVGLDLCAVTRMEALTEHESFLQKYFNEEERQYIRSRGKAAGETMAGIYAAKEAFLKAVGVGIVLPLKDVGVIHTEQGQPCYCLQGKAAAFGRNEDFLLSISHDGGVAAAVCIWNP